MPAADAREWRIPDDVLDDLVWQATHPAAVVTMDKTTLRALLAAYGRDVERVSVTERHGLRIVGSVAGVTGETR